MTEHYDVQVVKPGDVWVGEDADCMVWGDLVEVVPAGEWVNRDRRQRVGKGERKRNKAERWR
jgi:hypothetical protein